jgi:CsoR family transcriptional regulator, copper-sensing transcriptional repressor
MDISDQTQSTQSNVTDQSDHIHAHRDGVLKRLARIEGHVRAVKRMIEEDTACPDVLIQIAAVRAALNSVGKLILEDHMQSCMIKAAQEGDFEDSFRDLKKALDQFID